MPSLRVGKTPSILLAVFLAASPVAGFAATAGQDVWDAAFDSVKKERFIPVELWAGAEWDGARDLKMANAELRFGDREHKEIKGPMEWEHPDTGETLLVYERTNRDEKGGIKLQLFALNEVKNGLGRVSDSSKEGVRTFSGGLKFPVGYWKQGETRQVTEKRYERGRIGTRTEFITITRLDFEYQGVSHCLEFDWLYRDGAKVLDRQTYTYCPGQGMVRQIKH
jgi:hypothetical protein